MSPKSKFAMTARRVQSKSTSKHLYYVPPELAGSSTRKKWVSVLNRKIAATKIQSKVNAAGISSDEREREHEYQGSKIAGEDEKGEDDDDIHGSSNGKNDQDMADFEDQPRVFDEDGNQIPLDKLTAFLKKCHRAGQSQSKKRCQVIEDDSDEEDPCTPVPNPPKRQRLVKREEEMEPSEKEEAGAEGAGTNQTLAAEHSGMDSAQKAALDKTNRQALQELCGYKTAYDAEPQREDDEGEPLYRRKDGRNEVVTPAWKMSPEANWKVWGKDFMVVFREKSKANAHRKFLNNLTKETVFAYFKTRTWQEHKKYATHKENGTFEDSVEKHKRQTLMNTRASALFTRRKNGRKGTSIEGEEFDPVFAKPAQSPVYLDPQDKKHVVRVEAEWMSEEVIKLKAAADELSQLSGKDATVKYVKYDLPISKPGNGKRYPRWMASDSYIEAHPDTWKAKRFMFDHKATKMPEAKGLDVEVGQPERIYLDEPPEWVKAQLDTDLAVPGRSHRPTKN